MKISVGKFNVAFYAAADYDKNSADNPYYDKVIDFGEEYSRTIAAEIDDGINTRKIAMVVPVHTFETGIAMPLGDKLFMILSNILCIFDPEKAEVEKQKNLGIMGMVFEAYPYEDDFILYGEMEIYRVDKELDVKWTFLARDIFVRLEGSEPAFQMKADRICLYDFCDNYYEIDYEGRLLTDIPAGNDTSANAGRELNELIK